MNQQTASRSASSSADHLSFIAGSPSRIDRTERSVGLAGFRHPVNIDCCGCALAHACNVMPTHAPADAKVRRSDHIQPNVVIVSNKKLDMLVGGDSKLVDGWERVARDARCKNNGRWR